MLSSRWKPIFQRTAVHQVRVNVPHIVNVDGEDVRRVALLTFTGDDGAIIDRRRIKREIRKWVRRNLDRTLHTAELRLILRWAVVETYE